MNKVYNTQWIDGYLEKYMQQPIHLQKNAAKFEDVMELYEAAQQLKQTGTISYDSILYIRNILGRIMRNNNDISKTYKIGVRGYEIQQKAAELIPDLENFSDLQNTSIELINVLSSIRAEQGQNEESVKRGIMHLTSLLQSFIYMGFSPEQIQAFKQIASGTFTSQRTYAEEIDPEGAETFLKGSIYSTKNDYEKVAKLIREILQNAVDATMKVRRDNPAHRPEVKIYTSLYGDSYEDNSYMDITIVDNGTGMDLETLTKGFYGYFRTGKKNDQESTGGFGAAKAIIQGTPKEGWSLETNDLGSTSFHKNMFYADKNPDQYQHPKLSIARNGTQLNLYHVPQIADDNISLICAKYASGEINIYVNNQLVEPKFNFSSLKKVDTSGSGIVDVLSSNTTEQELAQKVVEKNQTQLQSSNAGGYEWNFKNEKGEDRYIKISFYVVKNKGGGKFHVRLNGQHQYESGWISQCDIICEIQTNIRPNEEFYPMDPGRENLRSPVKETVEQAKTAIEKLIKDITDNELFKEGLDVYVYNKDKSPMRTDTSDFYERKERQSKFMERMQSTGIAQTALFQETEMQASEAAAALKQISELHPDMTARQQVILENVAQAILKEKDAIDTQEFLDDVIDMLETPCEITIQKNFVTDSVAHDDIELTSTMAVLWQKVLKIIIAGSKSVTSYRSKEFIPGLIYSDKAIALYSPKNPRAGRMYDTISINPMFIASIVNPELFDEYLSGKISDETKEGRESITKDETPINRLSVFLFHEAVHELTHLLFPDFYSDNFEQFHMWISKMENINHYNFNNVRDEVKRYMPQLKKDTDKLIRRVKKDHKRSGKGVVTPD